MSDQIHPFLPCATAGAILTLEAVQGLRAVLHGPMGCKFFMGSLVDSCDPKGFLNDPRLGATFQDLGQARVPCSAITPEDLVLGTSQRARDAAARALTLAGTKLVVLVESCSARLTGEDLEPALAGLDGALALQEHMPAGGFHRGIRAAALFMVQRLMAPAKRHPDGVNLLGLSLHHPGAESEVSEWTALLATMGLEVGAVLFGPTTLDEVRLAPGAALNVVLDPDLGLEVALEMERRFHVPYVALPGPPLGFDGTDALLERVGQALGRDAGPALKGRFRVEAKVQAALSRGKRKAFLDGVRVAVLGEGRRAQGLMAFLEGYLGMCPVLLVDWAGLLQAPSPCLLVNPQAADVLAALERTRPQVVFGSTLDRALVAGACDHWAHRPQFITFAYPLLDRVHLRPRPFTAYGGVLTVVEELLNCSLAGDFT